NAGFERGASSETGGARMVPASRGWSVDARLSRWKSRTRSPTEGGRTMAYSIRCADAGVDCPGSFTTETKEELMKHVELHAKEAHPDLDLQPQQVEELVTISH